MYIELIAEILVATLAVFGLYTVLRVFVTSHLLPLRAGAVIEIRAQIQPQEISLLLDRVRDHLFFCGMRRIVALVDDSLMEDAALLDALRARNVKIYFVKL